MAWRGAAVLLALGLLVFPGCASTSRAPDDTARFDALGSEFLVWFFAEYPVRATFLGVHDHDDRLQDLSSGNVERRVASLQAWLERLASIDPAALPVERRFDHRILDHAIRAQLLELSEVSGWRHNPMRYNREIADGVASLIDREFAPLEVRLEALISRMDGIPAVVAAARSNLRDVPRTWIEIATRSTRGTRTFLERDVPAALEAQGFGDLAADTRRRWTEAHETALQEVNAFVAWVEIELPQRAGGDFRLGPELLERKLKYEEHVDLSVAELIERNENAIRDYLAWVERVSAELDSDRSASEVMEAIANDHPSPEDLIADANACVDRALAFVEDRQLVTLPSHEMPIVRPTPAYARSGFASMSTPGPFETVATEAYYNLTNVDPDWTVEQQRQHLTYFNHPGLLGISVHEVMPGHYVQLLYQRDVASDIRRVFVPRSLVEGWAHYAEQMMVDEGLGDGDPRVRLGQLRRALQRHARWYAGVAMHAQGTSLDEVARRFEEIAFFAPFPARRETERGTYDPTYLYYALGRMELLDLREDYRAYLEARGEAFSLREFHDRFLGLGLPIALARDAMMPEAG